MTVAETQSDFSSLLFDASPVPMWVFDTETLRFLDVNEAAVAQYGFTRDEFLGMMITDIRPADDVPGFRVELDAHRQLRVHGPRLVRHRRKDGTVFTVEVRAQDFVLRARPSRLVFAQPVGERERHAAELRRQERFLQAIVDDVPAVVFAQDVAGRFILTNEACERLMGLSRRQALGKTVYDLFPRAVADRLRGEDRSVLESGVATEKEVTLPFEAGERTFLTTLFPLRSVEGLIEGLVGLAVDVTERRRAAAAEQAARDFAENVIRRAEQEHARLSRVVEQTTDSIMITDPQGAVTYVNPAFEKVSGYSREDVIGQNARILKSGYQDAAFYRRMWEALSRGETWKGRLVNRRKDGMLFQEDATIGPVRDASGRLVNYVAVKRDVTAEMLLERQLVQAQKMEAVGRLAGGVAHDFNNLLGVITGYAEITRRKLGERHPVQAKVDEILKAASRAAGLTRQLLAFSRQQVLQPRILDLNALVTDIETMLRRLLGEDLQLTTSLDPRLGRVKADPGQMEQVLMNLAVNARDAMPDGGHLTIETANVDLDNEAAARRPPTRAGSYVMLAVTDSGMGMDAETQSHMFEPFFTTKDVGKGTGLGLSTVYGIVKQSDGYVWCYSEVGVGTTFKVYLPRVDGQVARERKASRRRAHGTETVLLIEDDPALRDVISEILESAGYTVLVADGGENALAIAEEFSGAIALVVTDVVMPGLSGRQAAEKIQSARSEVEILFISGYTSEAIAKHGVLHPGAKFLSKPFTSDALLRKVRSVLDRR